MYATAEFVETLFITLFVVLFCHSNETRFNTAVMGMCFFFSRNTFYNIPQALFAFIMMEIEPTQFGEYVFPEWADILGWVFGSCTLLPFIVAVIYHLIRGKVSLPLFVSIILWLRSRSR